MSQEYALSDGTIERPVCTKIKYTACAAQLGPQ